jgi:hypothetical protein
MSEDERKSRFHTLFCKLTESIADADSIADFEDIEDKFYSDCRSVFILEDDGK